MVVNCRGSDSDVVRRCVVGLVVSDGRSEDLYQRGSPTLPKAEQGYDVTSNLREAYSISRPIQGFTVEVREHEDFPRKAMRHPLTEDSEHIK